MKVDLQRIRECLDGATPAVAATCARDGTPNVAFLSQAQYVDPQHVALTFQFFNKTRKNVLEHPRARLLVWHPVTAAMYRLDARYERTETEGPTFERLRAMLAGIASHTGLDDVFHLRGADIYRVFAIDPVPGRTLVASAPAPSHLPALRAASERLLRAGDLDALCQDALAALSEHFDVVHSMILSFDLARRALSTIASHGYPVMGIGAEIPLGAGVIGVAARERVAIRITHITNDRSYVVAAREAAVASGARPGTEIPWPGLARPGSQLALPIIVRGELLGVLFVESPRDGRFGYDDEDALAVFSAHLGSAMVALQPPPQDDSSSLPAPPAPIVVAAGAPAVLKHYKQDDSIFLDGEYVIKGVAGAILWSMACDYVRERRVSFTNRELRVDPRIPLPELGDNLEARLVLLQRRLVEKRACLQLERTGRGRLSLRVDRPLELVEIA
jgi:adenylate cyclase